MAGFAPAHSGFADRRVNYFTTWPLFRQFTIEMINLSTLRPTTGKIKPRAKARGYELATRHKTTSIKKSPFSRILHQNHVLHLLAYPTIHQHVHSHNARSCGH